MESPRLGLGVVVGVGLSTSRADDDTRVAQLVDGLVEAFLHASDRVRVLRDTLLREQEGFVLLHPELSEVTADQTLRLLFGLEVYLVDFLSERIEEREITRHGLSPRLGSVYVGRTVTATPCALSHQWSARSLGMSCQPALKFNVRWNVDSCMGFGKNALGIGVSPEKTIKREP